jgi:hypothetical protein
MTAGRLGGLFPQILGASIKLYRRAPICASICRATADAETIRGTPPHVFKSLENFHKPQSNIFLYILSPVMTERLQQFLSHLKPGNTTGLAALSQKNPDDVVITLAVRTPLTKARKGGLKDTTLEHMLLRLYEVKCSQISRSLM